MVSETKKRKTSHQLHGRCFLAWLVGVCVDGLWHTIAGRPHGCCGTALSRWAFAVPGGAARVGPEFRELALAKLRFGHRRSKAFVDYGILNCIRLRMAQERIPFLLVLFSC